MMRNYRFALAALALAALTVRPEMAEAVRLPIPVLVQVTTNSVGDIQDPKLRLEPPYRINFTSDGDVLGTSPGQPEIFEYDFDTRTLKQLTDSAPGQAWDPARTTDITQTVRQEFTAYVSTGNPTGENADGNQEIFIRIRETGEIRQITHTTGTVFNADPYPSDSGRCIVFSSTGDLNDNPGSPPNGSNNPGPQPSPFSNPDASEEVFLLFLDNDLNVEIGETTQVSNGPAGTKSSNPVIGGFYYPRQCNSTFYLSDTIQTHIPSDHTFGTHLYEYVKGSGSGNVLAAQEIPFPNFYPPSGDYYLPGMSSASNFARGPFAVFTTDTDVWNNGNSRPNLFRFRSFHPRMTQYTDVKGMNEDIRNPVMSDGGRFIVFESNAALGRKPANKSAAPLYDADGNYEIWRMQKRRKIQQITDSPAGCENTQASLSDRGLNIAFRSTCDLIPGKNPNKVPQVFYYLQVKKDDPLATAAGCDVDADLCCNEANGCLTVIDAKAYKPNKINCILRDKCQ